MSEEATGDVAQQLLMNKIIAGALMVGVVLITATLVFVNGGKSASFGVLSAFGLVVGFACLSASLIVPGIVARSPATEGGSEDKSDTDRRMERFGVSVVVRYALLEGAAVLNVVLFVVEPWWPQLGVVALMLVVMAMNFPTESRWRDYVEAREREERLGER
ncbi:MAG: hypothetical protein AAF797_13640 [Planctomycetota bacterium]